VNELYNNFIPVYSSLDDVRQMQVGLFGGMAGLLGGTVRGYFNEGGGLKGLRTFLHESKEASNSFVRNAYAGVTAALISTDIGYNGGLDVEITMKFIEALTITGFVITDRGRRNPDTENSQNNHKTLEESL